jgi:NTE family protein
MKLRSSTHHDKQTASLRPSVLLKLLMLSGRRTCGSISNQPSENPDDAERYSLKKLGTAQRSDDITVLLAFSGGGTRAAALAYGVLEELRDTVVHVDGQSRRLLDEVDTISAVSGGSFTAAYYGLHGEGIFTDFETTFLRRDVKGELLGGMFNTVGTFRNRGRTETAVEFFDKTLFKGATFADLQRKNGPLIVINASDLGSGTRFSFLQEYFDLLCSDLSSYPVARAVMASSAVPVVFNPVVLENFPGRQTAIQEILDDVARAAIHSPQLAQVVSGLKSYRQKNLRRFIHLVDGGMTDNLGLRALYEIIEIAGGPKALLGQIGRRPSQKLVVVSVNAAIDAASAIEQSNQTPTIEQTILATAGMQLHLYNAATLELVQDSLQRWTAQMSTPLRRAESYFIEVGFDGIAEAKRRRFLKSIPTSFTLTREQVDGVITAGHELLRNNAEYQRLLRDLAGANGRSVVQRPVSMAAPKAAA